MRETNNQPILNELPTKNMPPTRQEIQDLARQAGEILRSSFISRPGFEQAHTVKYKSLIDLVTDVDLRSEAFLLGEIRQRFPDHRIIAEESGRSEGSACCEWLVDPLDGTVNYAHGVPIFSVSIAYLENGLAQIGAVYDPMQDECFSAERGQGAYLNDLPIRPATADTLEKSLLVTGFPYETHTIQDNNLKEYARFALLSQGVRRLGSAALDLCYTAAGRFDGYWELFLKPWDVAAGTLIAEEAGATVTSIQGDPDYLAQPISILVANPVIHALMLDVLRKTRNDR